MKNIHSTIGGHIKDLERWQKEKEEIITNIASENVSCPEELLINNKVEILLSKLDKKLLDENGNVQERKLNALKEIDLNIPSANFKFKNTSIQKLENIAEDKE